MIKVNKSHNKYYFLVLLYLCASLHAIAQAKIMDSATLAATKVMTSISLATEAYDNQQFNMVVIASDGSIQDTTSGTCTIQGDNYKCVFDSVEQIQNSFMNLEIHHDGKIFIVSRPSSFSKQFFKGNINESLFQQMNVNTVSISTSGANKILTFNFLPESEYKAYSITYNPTTYRVSNVYTQTKIADANGVYSATTFITTNITFQNFVSISSGAVSFDTSPYVFIGTGNVIQKQTAYADFQVVDMYNENN